MENSIMEVVKGNKWINLCYVGGAGRSARSNVGVMCVCGVCDFTDDAYVARPHISRVVAA